MSRETDVRIEPFYLLISAILIFSLVSLALSYFLPVPPTTVTIATTFKGTSFDYFGQRYRERFPLAFANQIYDLRGHIDIVRRRLTHDSASAPSSDPIQKAAGVVQIE